MKNLIKYSAVCALVGAALNINAVTVTLDTSTYSDATTFMSWSQSAYTAANYPANGGSGAGGWSLGALPANISGGQLTLSPNVNTYADNPGVTYWVNGNGSGANKMTGAVYTQTTGGALGVSTGLLTFTYDVLANTLDGSAPYGGYTANAFIKVFTPGFGYFFGLSSAALTPGVGSVSFDLGSLTDGNVANVVQYGFELVGPNANPATVASLGLVTIAAAPVPEPSTLVLAGMGGMALLTCFRRRSNK